MVDLIFSSLAELLGVCMEGLVDLILPVFGFTFDTFNQAFPFAKTAYSIFQSVALGIVLLLAAVQIVPFFMGSSNSKSTPIRAGLFAILAVFGIYYGNYITTAIMDIAQMPYDALMAADVKISSIDINPVIAVIRDACYSNSVLLYIILLVLVGIAFIKLLLEAVERYVVLFVMIYLTPLAASTLASEMTSGVFKKFFTMFISQCVLLILNVWSLQMISSLFQNMMGSGDPMITLLVGYAFLRVASRLDSYLNSLGLNAAVTGVGLGIELLTSGMTVLSKMSPHNNGNKSFSSESSGGASGNVLGASIASGVGKASPVAGAAIGITNAVGGLGKTIKEGVAVGKEAASEASSGKVAAGIKAGADAIKENIGGNMHDSFMKTQNQSLWARSIGQAAAAASGTSVNDTVAAMTNTGDLTDQQMRDISNNTFVADKAYNSVSDDMEISEPATVAAVMQGIGLTKTTPDAKEAIEAGSGAIDADALDYSITASGSQMRYEKDGKVHSWNVKNATQFTNLSAQEKQGYTAFKNDNGHTYYVKHDASRAATEAQKQQAAKAVREEQIFTKAAQFGTSPNIDVSDYAYMQTQPKSKQNQFINTMFESVAQSDSTIELNEQTQDQFAEILSTGSWKGVSSSMQSDIVSAVKSGSTIKGSFDYRGFSVGADDGKNVCILTSNVISTDGEDYDAKGNPLYTREYLENRGYAYNNIDGKEYWAKADMLDPRDKFMNTFEEH